MLLGIIAILSFIIGLTYIVGAIRTKDKSPAYIGIVLISICLLCLYFLAFK